MDLFGRKARQQLAEVVETAQLIRIENARITGELRQLDTVWRDVARDNRRLEAAIHEHELARVRAEGEVERLKAELKPFQASPSPIKLYKSEDEEEAEYAYHTGNIDFEEYQRLMERAGFENTTVDLAPEVSDIRY